MIRKRILAALLLPAILLAQSSGGEIRLDVKDPSGAAMQASAKLQNLQTGVTRTFQTGPAGNLKLGNLSAARYRLDVSSPGFATQSEVFDLLPGRSVSRDIVLQIGVAAARVDVVAPTPLAGADLSVRDMPAPVQTANQQDLSNSAALDLPGFLNRRLSGVSINENQGNPFQPDLNYRGYTASPLLGTPQGISVYVDGVRQNQPFGDVVSWDLIPRIAISEVALVPGSNPLFGLNSLGGAVSVQTKDGRGNPGTSLEVYGGSFGRRAAAFEHGGSNPRGLNWYLAGNLLKEDGWRIKSPSEVRQIFGKLGWQGMKTTISLTSAYADNDLTGNGLQEQRLLAANYRSGYTYGDTTANRSPFFNLSLRRSVYSSLTFAANAYYRYIRANTVNPNLNTDSLDESVERCIAAARQLAEPIKACNGVIVHSFTKQNNYGLSGQMTWSASSRGRRNQLTAGTAWDRSGLAFLQATQFGYLNPDHTIAPVNAFEDGSTSQDGTPVDTRVNLHGVPQTWSLYATDTLSIGNAWSFNVSGRYNRALIDNRDRIAPGGGPGSLDGRYAFGRFNPSAGVTFTPMRLVNLYASYAESSRAPTSIELGCADPDNPCNLPNALAGDPPLKQVVTRTVEAGIRGANTESGVNWSAGWFRAVNDGDLLFVASGVTGNGYFKNFGRTLRQGLESHVSGKLGRAALGGNYTFLRATYRSSELVNGSSNSTNDPASSGVIQIQPGDRIPLIPQHMFRAFADAQLTRKLSADVDFVAVSSAYARGNENNQSRPDGLYYLGPGRSPGYGVLNLAARYQVQKHLQFFAQIDNLLDHRYYTAAQLGPTGFTGQGAFMARPSPVIHATFYAPGAPFGIWGGMRFSF